MLIPLTQCSLILAGTTFDSGLYAALGALCLVLIAVAWLRRAQQGGATARAATRAQRARLREEGDLQRDMEELLAQVDELARRVDAQVAGRLARLEQLIRAADERLERLAPPASQPPAPQTNCTPPGSAEPHARNAEPSIRPVRTPPERVASDPTGMRSREADHAQRVCALADAGASAATIADALGMPIGEVELRLALRKYRAGAGASGASRTKSRVGAAL